MLKLVVEGWRTSFHSYALVNQHQLLFLRRDPRFDLRHRDVPFFRPEWATLDSGLDADEKNILSAIPTAPWDEPADVIYRVSYPIRLHGDGGRVFVFATSEFCPPHRSLDLVGHDGRRESARPDEVEIITTSQWSRAGFLAAGVAADRVHVVPLGVNASFAREHHTWKRADIRSALEIPRDAFVFLNIGAMTANKGSGPLLAAFAAHRRRHPRSILILKAGESLYGNLMQGVMNEARQLRAEAHDGDLLGAIRYVSDSLSASEIASLYGAADTYVSPYRAEGFNLTVLEAMAAGLPVAVTGGGATDDFCPADLSFRISADFVRHPEGHGYLEPRVESIVEQLDRAVDDHLARERLARGGASWALERYPWARVTGALADLLAGDRP